MVYRAQQYIREHFNQPLTPDRIARKLHVEPGILRRRFKAVEGMSLRQYQERLRVDAAVALLEDTDLKVEAVARQIGYASKKELYRLLRRHVGRTPQQIRMRRGAGERIAGHARPQPNPRVHLSR